VIKCSNEKDITQETLLGTRNRAGARRGWAERLKMQEWKMRNWQNCRGGKCRSKRCGWPIWE